MTQSLFKMELQKTCLAFCIFAVVTLSVDGFEFHWLETHSLDRQLKCAVDANISSQDIFAIIDLTIFDVTSNRTAKKLAAISVVDTDLYIDHASKTLVDVQGSVSRHYADLVVTFSNQTYCLFCAYMCELNFINPDGYPVVRHSTVQSTPTGSGISLSGDVSVGMANQIMVAVDRLEGVTNNVESRLTEMAVMNEESSNRLKEMAAMKDGSNVWLKEMAAMKNESRNWLKEMAAMKDGSNDWLKEMAAMKNESKNLLKEMAAMKDGSNDWLKEMAAMKNGSSDWLKEMAAMKDGSNDWLKEMAAMQNGSSDWLKEMAAMKENSNNWLKEMAVIKEEATNWLNEMAAMKNESKNWMTEMAAMKEESKMALERFQQKLDSITGLFTPGVGENKETNLIPRTNFGNVLCKQGMANATSEPRILVTVLDNKTAVCDTKTDGGGWIVFQRRTSGKENFYRPWKDYVEGFGDLENGGSFWLGLQSIHEITYQGNFELRVDFEIKGRTYYAHYSDFFVGNEFSKYQLRMEGYSGNATNALGYGNHEPFSTYDNDNDDSSINCAESEKAGWWYDSCRTNPNGLWQQTSDGDGVSWKYKWIMHFVEMKMRLKKC